MATITWWKWWKMTGTKHATGCKTMEAIREHEEHHVQINARLHEDDRSLEVNKVKRLHEDEHRDH